MSTLLRQAFRNFSKSQTLFKKKSKQVAREVPSANFKKMKANQAVYQQQDGLPVWLKNGFRDKVIYNITLLGLLIGMGMSTHVLVLLALPK